MDENLLRETYRLSLENNKMLHRMRRNAFWGGIVKTIVYAALLAAPIWFYLSYMAPIVDKMLNTIQQVQGTGAQAQVQLNSFQDAWKQFQEKMMPGQQ